MLGIRTLKKTNQLENEPLPSSSRLGEAVSKLVTNNLLVSKLKPFGSIPRLLL